jgi:uncharacterized tellurite resistance protein B-like protein
MTTRAVYLLLAEVAVADGTTHADEVEALLAAARGAGLADDDLAAIERAARTHAPVDVDVAQLDAEERRFVYAVAYWISRIDGEMSEAEDAVLGKLGKRLEIPDEPRMGIEAAVDAVAAMAPGERPERFDLGALRKLIADA